MTGKEFMQWLEDHNACLEAVEWALTQRYQTPRYLWENCNHGEWMLWLLDKTEPGPDVLVVAYRAVNRAMTYAGVNTATVFDATTCEEAARAAWAAWAAEAAGGAAWAAWAARAAEHQTCANDCRELLDLPELFKLGG